jgi:hypothetical protein
LASAASSEKLIELEAKTRGTTSTVVIDAEITSKIQTVTEADVWALAKVLQDACEDVCREIDDRIAGRDQQRPSSPSRSAPIRSPWINSAPRDGVRGRVTPRRHGTA